MKSLKHYILLALIPLMVIVVGCKKDHDDEISIMDRQLTKLNSAWKSSGVILDGIAKDGYDNFVLTTSGDQGSKTINFTTEGRPGLSPWPSAGTFTFDESAPLTGLIRDDDVLVSYEVSETTLTLKFDYDIAGFQGRVNAVKGQWEFRFAKP